MVLTSAMSWRVLSVGPGTKSRSVLSGSQCSVPIFGTDDRYPAHVVEETGHRGVDPGRRGRLCARVPARRGLGYQIAAAGGPAAYGDHGRHVAAPWLLPAAWALRVWVWVWVWVGLTPEPGSCARPPHAAPASGPCPAHPE